MKLDNNAAGDMVDFEELTKHTYTTIARDYCTKTPSPEVRLAIIESIHWFCKYLPRNAEVLVVGAGDGRDAEVLSGIGHTPILIDYCQEMIVLAKQRLPNREIVLGDIGRLEEYFEGRTFHGVWGSACLYHLTKDRLRNTISAIYNLLRPDGVFYLNLRKGQGEQLIERPRSYPEGGPRFYAFYEQREVIELISVFEILKIVAVDPVLKEDYYQVWLRRRG